MSEETKVFESELAGGIKYEIHVSKGFSSRSEIAIKVEGEIISVVSAEIKKGGNIHCRPTMTKPAVIKKGIVDISDKSPLNLDDVIPGVSKYHTL